MKKKLSFILVITVIICNAVIPVNAGTVMNISAENKTAKPCDTVSVDFTISNNPGFCYLKLTPFYNENILELQEITNGDVSTDSFTKGNSLSWDSAENTEKNGILCTLTFKVKESAVEGNYAVGFIFKECYDYNENDVNVSMQNGYISVHIHHFTQKSILSKYLVKKATCSEPAEYYYCCSCGEIGNETFTFGLKNSNNHNGSTEIRNKSNATCGIEGYTGDTYCKGCGVKLSSGTTIKATGNHTWNSGEETISATCTTEGVKMFTCTVCPAIKTEKIAKNNSNHTGGTEVRNAKSTTCSKNGYTGDTYCKGCGVKLSSGTTVNATGNHTWNGGTVTTSATCTTEGVKTFTCTECSATITEKIVKSSSNHTGGIEVKNVKSATCGNDGYTGDIYCKGCGVKLSGGITVKATGSHTWNSGTVTKKATCKDEGVITYTCTVCKTTKTEKIAKNSQNHTGGTEVRNAKSPTCINDGYTGDIYCKGCGVKLSSGTTVNATGNHTWNSGTVTTSATCTTEGVKAYTCTVCKTTKTEKIAKNSQNHTGGTEIRNAKSATCGNDGYTGDIYCKGCGVKLSSGTTVNATGNHTWNSGTVTTSATCTTEGVKTYTCTVCKTTKTEKIAKNSQNHTGDTEIRNAKSPTCINDGYTGDTYCNGCGVKLSDGTTVKATGKHTYGKWSVKTAPTYEKDGVQVRYCTVCKAEETGKIDKLVASESAKDESTGIQLGFADGIFESGVKLEVKTVAKDADVFKAVSESKPNCNFEIFDISVTKDNAKVQPNGNVQITVPVPENFDSDSISVYYVKDNGETEKLQSYVKDGKIVFETNHFSYYAIVNEASVTLGDVNGDTKINTKDARLILRYAAKLEKFTPEQEKAADVNSDTKVNTKDARKILRVVAKLETI